MSQQPTFHITKEHFVGVINSLHEQFVKDKQRSEAISEIFHTEAGFYDNSALINAVFSFLHEVFPKDDDGHSEIEFYCYTLNFGKNGEEYESPEDLFDRLILDVVHVKEWLTLNDPSAIHYEGSGDEVDKKFEEVIRKYKEGGGKEESNALTDEDLYDNYKPNLNNRVNPEYFKDHFLKPSPDETA